MLGRCRLLRPPAVESTATGRNNWAVICSTRRIAALSRCYATGAAGGGGKNKYAGQEKIKTSLFDGVLDDDKGGDKTRQGAGRGRDNENHPANSKQQKEQGLYRDPPRADKDRPKSAQQVRLPVERG
jgi:hypothetical protein